MFSIEPAYLFYEQLQNKLTEASKKIENQWFFTSGAFDGEYFLDKTINTGKKENFVIIANKEVIAYFTGIWNIPLQTFDGFSIISFSNSNPIILRNSLFQVFDYLFCIRGCKVLSWLVAEKNEHAIQLYRKFILKYFGREIGKKTRGQKGYSGEISDVFYFEITHEQYLKYKTQTYVYNVVENNYLKTKT